jgi:serine protease Do
MLSLAQLPERLLQARLWIHLLPALLVGCISHEPRQLVPSVTLSPEVVVLSEGTEGGGVNFGMVTSINESDSLTNLSVLPGVRVRSVTPNGAAERAGIRAGDVILSVNGRETNHPDLLDALAQETDSETTFALLVRRNTTVFEATVNAVPVAGTQAPVELFRADPIASRAGFETVLIDNAGEPISGARIVELYPESPLPAHGFQVGDVIMAVDGQPVESAQGLINALHTRAELGDTVRLGWARDGRTAEDDLRLWDPGHRISSIRLWPFVTYDSTLVPDRTRLRIFDFWLFSLFSYEQVEGEKAYELFEVFRVATGTGELREESQ